MKIPFDRVIVSANEHWLYLDFWPLVAYAYRTLFPGVQVTLAFLSERAEMDPFVAELRKHGDVELIRPVRDVPQAAQAKLARYYIAAQKGPEVCMIEDIDVLPIDRQWHLVKTEVRKPATMLLIGSEVYHGEGGQCPASMMTAEGHVFERLFNVDDKDFSAWINSLKNGASDHSNIESRAYNEGMECSTCADFLGQPLFSDEALIVKLRNKNPVPVTYARRDYKTGIDTIDRAWWNALDLGKLDRGEYLTAHTGRPYWACRAGNDAIIDYIRRRYEGEPAPGDLECKRQVDADMKFATDEQRQTFEEALKFPLLSVILQYGSDHVLTNYLSRYYYVVVVEPRRDMLNIYPAHYIHCALDDDAGVQKELQHPRLKNRQISMTIR